MIETNWFKSLSLVVASFTLSHVIAIVFKVETADDVNWLSISWDHDSSGGSSQRMPAMIECRVGPSGGELTGLPMAAMSSVSVSRSGLVGPVGCMHTGDMYHSKSVS